MGSRAGMLNAAKKHLGMRGRPNTITRWYSNRNGNAFLRAPWCDMAITYWAKASDNYDAVCFGKDYAYTVWHAQEFQRRGQWHYGTSNVKPGDIIFFQWEGGSRSIGKIDHVGVVERVTSNYIYTIEGNTGDACLRKARRKNSLVCGVGRPKYGTGGGTSGSVAAPKEAIPDFRWYSKGEEQTIPSGEWHTVNFNNKGPGAEAGDYWSVLFGPEMASVTFSFEFDSSLPEGTEVQARIVWYDHNDTDGWHIVFEHPINSYVHKSGKAHFVYRINERLTDGKRGRLRVAQYSGQDAKIVGAKATILAWRED